MAISASWQDVGAPKRLEPARATRSRAFLAARRHTRLVRILRVLLPAAACVAVAGFFVKVDFGLPGDLDLSAATLSVTRNSIIMDHPHVTGFAGDGREYSLSADRAIQPLNNPGQVRLETIEAKITTAEGTTTSVTAEAGDYDHQKSAITLLGPIRVDSADGYNLNMTDAEVDFHAGTLATDNRISIGYAESEIAGDRLSVGDGGKHVVIEGRVRTVLMPPKRQAPAPPSAPNVAE
jgi:lipopolysaccharide export system protein LptC